MGHEVILFGCIEGAEPERWGGLNAAAVAGLPAEDEWPWLVPGMFALPVPWPRGTYRTQVIHFGASLKDEPGDRSWQDVWLSKFESLLRRMYWWSATVHLQTEFEPDRVFRWVPTADAIDQMTAEPPHPVGAWERFVVRVGPGEPAT